MIIGFTTNQPGGKSIFWFLIIIMFGIDFVLIFLPLETNTKTCLETKFQTDQDQDLSWNEI